MNGLRTSIEHSFGLFNNLQKILSKTYVLKILNKRGFIVKRILVYWIVLNCYTCLNENTVSTMFDLQPPDIIDYLRIDIPPSEGKEEDI